MNRKNGFCFSKPFPYLNDKKKSEKIFLVFVLYLGFRTPISENGTLIG